MGLRGPRRLPLGTQEPGVGARRQGGERPLCVTTGGVTFQHAVGLSLFHRGGRESRPIRSRVSALRHPARNDLSQEERTGPAGRGGASGQG